MNDWTCKEVLVEEIPPGRSSPHEAFITDAIHRLEATPLPAALDYAMPDRKKAVARKAALTRRVPAGYFRARIVSNGDGSSHLYLWRGPEFSGEREKAKRRGRPPRGAASEDEAGA